MDACICGELVEELGLAQATISQHLKELKNVGFIQGNIEGTSVCYSIDPKVWNQYIDVFSGFLPGVSKTLSAVDFFYLGIIHNTNCSLLPQLSIAQSWLYHNQSILMHLVAWA